MRYLWTIFWLLTALPRSGTMRVLVAGLTDSSETGTVHLAPRSRLSHRSRLRQPNPPPRKRRLGRVGFAGHLFAVRRAGPDRWQGETPKRFEAFRLAGLSSTRHGGRSRGETSSTSGCGELLIGRVVAACALPRKGFRDGSFRLSAEGAILRGEMPEEPTFRASVAGSNPAPAGDFEPVAPVPASRFQWQGSSVVEQARSNLRHRPAGRPARYRAAREPDKHPA